MFSAFFLYTGQRRPSGGALPGNHTERGNPSYFFGKLRVLPAIRKAILAGPAWLGFIIFAVCAAAIVFFLILFARLWKTEGEEKKNPA